MAELLPMLQGLGHVCTDAQAWLKEREGKAVGAVYAEVPYNWLLWLHRHAAYGPREYTDRALRLLVKFSGVPLPERFLDILYSRDFNDTRWTTGVEWAGIVKAEFWVDANRKFTRTLLNLHAPTRNNHWVLFEAGVYVAGAENFGSGDDAEKQRRAFERAFVKEYPWAEMLERLVRAYEAKQK